MKIEIDASGLDELAHDIAKAPADAARLSKAAVEEAARRTTAAWRANATATAGRHGKHYPKSITYQVRSGGDSPEVEVGPDESKPQGGMGPGFEFGSINQPPHLDGQRALTTEWPKLERAIAELAGRVLW